MTVIRAASPLENAFRAQALLGPGIWSRIISIRNETRGGFYPRSVQALVFEFAGMLWFYTDANGTQSFSLHTGELEVEKKNFGPLLRDIDQSPVKQKLVASMTALCKDMGFLVVAEGIETIAERDCVRQLGCDLLQGFLFARPGRPFPSVSWG